MKMNSKIKHTAFYATLKRELTRMVSRRLYFGVCIVLPLFCIIFMSTIFGTGGMENIPVGIVDLDQTVTSREITRTLGTVSTCDVQKTFSDPLAARNAVLRKEIYAYIVIPNNFESDLSGGRNASIPYYIHYALLSVGIEVEAALAAVFAEIALAPVVVSGSVFGTNPEQVETVLLPANMEAHPLFNPSLDYSIYLTNPFFFVLFQVLILLITSYIIGGEIKFKTWQSWMEAANGNIYVAVFAKLLPYTIIFIIMGIFANFVIFDLLHIPMESSFFYVNMATVIFVIATQALAVFVFSLFPALSIMISILSMVGSLGATLSGVTFPVEYMHTPIYYLSHVFPIRHFVNVIQNFLYGNYAFAYVWQDTVILLIFIIPALLILPHLKRAILSRKYEDIE